MVMGMEMEIEIGMEMGMALKLKSLYKKQTLSKWPTFLNRH